MRGRECLVYSLLLLFVCSSVRSPASTQISLSIIPTNQPVYLGEEVILTCQLQRFITPLVYAVLFKHNEKGISEKCQAYKTDKYHVVCDPKNPKYATTYKLYIKSVSWMDRGDWYCIYAANLTTKRLEVFAPSRLQKMSVVSLASPRDGQRQSASGDKGLGAISSGFDASSLDGPPALSSTSSLSGQQQPDQQQQQQQKQQHLGYGTRVNPYDLRPGFELQLSCSTTCGHPAANISWTVANETVSKSNLVTARPNLVNGEACDESPFTKNMTTTKSVFNINCGLSDGLVGLNEVLCEVQGPQYERAALTRSVFILCPDEHELRRTAHQRRMLKSGSQNIHHGRGEKPIHLTSGEIIAIAVGVSLALIIVCTGCLLLRTNRKDSSPLLHFNHVPGQRV